LIWKGIQRKIKMHGVKRDKKRKCFMVAPYVQKIACEEREKTIKQGRKYSPTSYSKGKRKKTEQQCDGKLN